MRTHLTDILLADILLAGPLLLAGAAVTAASDTSDSVSVERALAYFAALPPGDARTALGAVRPIPVDAVMKRQALDQLPRDGELRPSVEEVAKLESFAPIVAFHTRYGILDIKVIDVPQGFMGLYARSVLLVSRPAIRLLSAAELQALAAHEMGHEYVWERYEQARAQHDVAMLRQLELTCDGIAALALRDLGLDPSVLIAAARKLTRFNAALGATANADNYPELNARARFIERLIVLWSQRRDVNQVGTAQTLR